MFPQSLLVMILTLLLVSFLALLLVLLVMIGFFREVSFAKDEQIEPFSFAYLKYLGPYNQVSEAFNKVETKAAAMAAELGGKSAAAQDPLNNRFVKKTAAVYLDNPEAAAPEKCRAVCGFRLTEVETNELQELLVKHGLEVRQVCGAKKKQAFRARVCTRSLRRGFLFVPSLLLAMSRVYKKAKQGGQSEWPELVGQAAKDASLRGSIELYDEVNSDVYQVRFVFLTGGVEDVTEIFGGWGNFDPKKMQ